MSEPTTASDPTSTPPSQTPSPAVPDQAPSDAPTSAAPLGSTTSNPETPASKGVVPEKGSKSSTSSKTEPDSSTTESSTTESSTTESSESDQEVVEKEETLAEKLASDFKKLESEAKEESESLKDDVEQVVELAKVPLENAVEAFKTFVNRNPVSAVAQTSQFVTTGNSGIRDSDLLKKASVAFNDAETLAQHAQAFVEQSTKSQTYTSSKAASDNALRKAGIDPTIPATVEKPENK
jgi:hypothetical protein